jgi:hypothetical protein
VEYGSVDLPNGEVLEVPVSEAHLIPPILVQCGPQNDAAGDRVCVRLMQHLLQVRGLRLRVQLVADVNLSELDGHHERGELVQDVAHHRRWSMDPLVPQP